MSNQAISQSLDATHLKKVFEQSLAMLDETKPNEPAETKHSVRSRGNAVPLRVDPVDLQKRALDDAAKALATLWKVSTPGHTRLNSRTIHHNR